MEPNFKNFKIPLKDPLSEITDSNGCEDFTSPLVQCHEVKMVYDNASSLVLTAAAPAEDMVMETISSPPTQSLKRKLNDCEVLFFGRDKSYPNELNTMLLPLGCTLCDAKFNSIKTGKVHYESKSHYKKIKNWLTAWAIKNGEGPPKIPKIFKDGPVGPNAFHCEACDLPLTSLQHASQHYNGKRHKMVIGNRSNPSGSGYYDPEGKWVRTPTTANDQRFGIGAGFQAVISTLPPPPPPPPAALPTDVTLTVDQPQMQQQLQPIIDPGSNRHCTVCNIWVTSELQMDMHLKGMKHAKKLKAVNQPPYAPPGDTLLATLPTAVSVPPNNVPPAVTVNSDVSMYRTPSGCFYCKHCNITVTDESVLLQHLSSKKHAKNSKIEKSIL